jgi:hypothetical protein
MENHIWVEDASVLLHEPSRFFKENFTERFSKQDHFFMRDNNLIKSKKRLVKGRTTYLEMHTTPLNVILIEIFTAIEDIKLFYTFHP